MSLPYRLPYTLPNELTVPDVVEPPRTVGNRSFWLRRNKWAEPEGPYTYYEAETKGRVATREAARTKVGDICMELITYVGSRPGDPPVPVHPRVVCIYLAGRKTTGGAFAQYNSDRGNT